MGPRYRDSRHRLVQVEALVLCVESRLGDPAVGRRYLIPLEIRRHWAVYRDRRPDAYGDIAED
jgi:hypothetical protein